MKAVSKKRFAAIAAAAAAVIRIASDSANAQLVSFPGAEGFGDLATGGRGGSVYVVTSLADSNTTGTLRNAVSQSGRIIVFAVGGYIDLSSPLTIPSNETILGQTAPGQGIGIMGQEVSLSEHTDDIIQYLRIRQGSGGSSTEDSLNLGDGTDMIFDHDSIEYGLFNNIDASGTVGIGNVTLQNSIIADPIKGQQFNFHMQGNTAVYPNTITVANNIFANAHNRNPLAKGNIQYVNNVVYNFQAGYTLGNTGGDFTEDIVNNYFITGPSTTSAGDAFFQMNSPGASTYAAGNLEDSNNNGVLDGSVVTPSGTQTLTSPGLPGTTLLPTLSTTAAYAFDVAHAGDTLSPDSVDSQVLSQVQSLGTQGSIYNSQGDTGLSNGGFGTITSGAAPTSTAGDGIPDTWAVTHGLSITDTQSATKLSALGYDMIEEYADQLADTYANQTWSAASGEWSANATNWSAALPGDYDHALVRGTGTANGLVTISNSGAMAFSLSIGGNGPAAGEMVAVTGGSLTVYNTITVGDQNNGTLQMTGGTVTAGNVQLGNTVWDTNENSTIYFGTLNLNGGTLQTSEVVQGGGSPSNWTTGSIWNWSGGTLQAGPNGLNVTAPATIGSGGAILDTDGESANMAGVLSGTGSLTKIGAGVALLIRTDSYSGGTIINAGALKAHTNGSLGSGTVIINDADGLQIQNGVTIPNSIIANGGASEVVDVPDASASATLAGNITLASQGSDQYRVGVSGAGSSLTLTGTSTVSSAISIITRGNIIFTNNGSLNVSANSLEIGRYSSTSSVNLSISGNGSVAANSIALGGLDSSSDDVATNVSLLGNGLLNARTGSLNLDNSDTAANTVTLSLGGTSNLDAGSFTEVGTVSGRVVTVNLNGGTINATASDPAGGDFLPAFSNTTFNVQTGGAIVNNGGFNITLAQPLVGSSNDGGFIAEGSGVTTLLGNNTYHGPTTVTNGTLVIGATGALPATAAKITGGTLQLGASTRAESLMSLSISGSGEFDVSNNHVFIDYGSNADPIASIAALLAAGYNGGLWNGAGGIVTSAPRVVGGLSYGLGYADGDDPQSAATGLASGTIEIKYTLLGDADLNGIVNGIDFGILASNFNKGVTGWDEGDFDYNGIVNGLDFGDLAANFNKGAAGADAVAALDAFAVANGLMADVPEPVAGGLVVMAGFGMLRRRRKISLQFDSDQPSKKNSGR